MGAQAPSVPPLGCPTSLLFARSWRAHVQESCRARRATRSVASGLHCGFAHERHYPEEQLSALDRVLLAVESRDVMMHVGGLLELQPYERYRVRSLACAPQRRREGPEGRATVEPTAAASRPVEEPGASVGRCGRVGDW